MNMLADKHGQRKERVEQECIGNTQLGMYNLWVGIIYPHSSVSVRELLSNSRVSDDSAIKITR